MTMRTLVRLLALPAVLALSPVMAAQSELRQALKDIETAPHWIYDDLPKAFAQAKDTGKPILVVLRCVPCPPGRTLDLKVMQPDRDLEALQKQFVCVRVVQTNGLDLKLFQYDYDQSWTAVPRSSSTPTRSSTAATARASPRGQSRTRT
jgi:hypothetical protein